MQQVQSPHWTSELVPKQICFFFSFLEAQSAVGLASHGNNLYYTRSGMLPRFARAILSRECGAPTRFLPSVVPVTAANVFSVVTLGDCIVKILFFDLTHPCVTGRAIIGKPQCCLIPQILVLGQWGIN